jgi:hypothetical protein
MARMLQGTVLLALAAVSLAGATGIPDEINVPAE